MPARIFAARMVLQPLARQVLEREAGGRDAQMAKSRQPQRGRGDRIWSGLDRGSIGTP